MPDKGVLPLPEIFCILCFAQVPDLANNYKLYYKKKPASPIIKKTGTDTDGNFSRYYTRFFRPLSEIVAIQGECDAESAPD